MILSQGILSTGFGSFFPRSTWDARGLYWDECCSASCTVELFSILLSLAMYLNCLCLAAQLVLPSSGGQGRRRSQPARLF